MSNKPVNMVGEEKKRARRGEKRGAIVISSKQERMSGDGDSHSSQEKENGVAERVGIEIPKENTLTTDEALVRERKGNEGNGELRIKSRAAGEGAQERDEAKQLRKQKTGDMEIEVLS